MKVRNMVYSILLGVVFTGGATAYILYIIRIGNLQEMKPAVIIVGIFGLVGIYAILATLFNIVKLILLREGLDGVGIYIEHKEQKHMDRKVDYSYWVVYYSHVDEKGKSHKNRHYVNSEAEAIAFQQKGKFPIKFRGWLSKVKD